MFEEKKDARDSHKRMKAEISQLNNDLNESRHSSSRINDFSFYDKQVKKSFDLLERSLLYSMSKVDYWENMVKNRLWS